jgi:hypothetical protein
LEGELAELHARLKEDNALVEAATARAAEMQAAATTMVRHVLQSIETVVGTLKRSGPCDTSQAGRVEKQASKLMLSLVQHQLASVSSRLQYSRLTLSLVQHHPASVSSRLQASKLTLCLVHHPRAASVS